MPRPRVSDPRRRQLLLRLTDAEDRVLRAVAHLEGVTPNHYALRLLTEHLATVEGNPHVRADIANTTAYRRSTASATPLRGGDAVSGRSLR